MSIEEIKLLSSELRLRRFKKELSQEQCAKCLDVSVPTYRNLEYNPNKLSVEQTFKLSELLEWNMFDFILNYILHNAIQE